MDKSISARTVQQAVWFVVIGLFLVVYGIWRYDTNLGIIACGVALWAHGFAIIRADIKLACMQIQAEAEAEAEAKIKLARIQAEARIKEAEARWGAPPK